MDDFWSVVKPLLLSLWETLVGISMAFVDLVFKFVSQGMEIPVEDMKLYSVLKNYPNVTTGVLLVIVYKILTGFGRKERTVVVREAAPKAKPPTPPAASTSSTTRSIHRETPPSSSTCTHSWRFTHKGVDKNYPRGHYKCSKCGAGGVEENLGDGRIQVL